MRAIETVPHDSPDATFDPIEDPLAAFATPSNTERRRREVARVADELANHAQAVGWKLTSRWTCSKGLSVYFDLRATRSRQITVRVSDHCPGRPLDPREMDRPLLVVVVETPGAVSMAARWLEANGSPDRIQGKAVAA